MLEDFQAGQQVILTRFDDYWKGWEGNHFDKVIIKAVPEAATKRQLISKGDIDITMELPPEDIEALKKDPNVNVMIEPSFQEPVPRHQYQEEAHGQRPGSPGHVLRVPV